MRCWGARGQERCVSSTRPRDCGSSWIFRTRRWENMRSAISRGDIDGASFRFDVGQEAWDGDVRTVKTVKALHNVTVATFPAYPAASVELRTKPARRHRRWTKHPCRPRAA